MHPRIPGILSEILTAADRKPTGSDLRIAALEALSELAHQAADWPTDQPRKYVNDWTLLLLTMLRKRERLGPLGDRIESARVQAVIDAVLPLVSADALEALSVRPLTTEQGRNG